MLNSKRNIGLFALFVILTSAMCSIFFNTDTSIMAQRPQRDVKIVTPGYYYVAPGSTSQNATTSLITLSISDFVRLPNYPTGLQVVFTTEEDNDTTAAVTLKIGHLPAKRLLTRHGQEFNLLELNAGVILTATYDGTDFISDYTAARSLKGRLIASVDIAADDYEIFQYIEGWTVATGVTEVGTANLPAAAGLLGNSVDRTNALLTMPTSRIKNSQLGWYFEILNGTTVVNTFFINFGEGASFAQRKTTDNADIVFFHNTHTSGSISGVTQDAIGFSLAGQLNQLTTVPAGYSIKMYLSEN